MVFVEYSNCNEEKMISGHTKQYNLDEKLDPRGLS